MNIIFDLDGTLIDSSERMYRLFLRLVPQCTLTKEQYWDFKRGKVNHKQLLDRYYPEVNFEAFNSQWMSLIETEEYLKMDLNYADTTLVLEALKKHSLYLLTARQSKENLEAELYVLGLNKYFEQIFVTEGKSGKKELLNNALGSGMLIKNDGDVFISDMGKDIVIGRELGYRTVAVTHGFMNRVCLEKYKPDFMVDELRELIGRL